MKYYKVLSEVAEHQNDAFVIMRRTVVFYTERFAPTKELFELMVGVKAKILGTSPCFRDPEDFDESGVDGMLVDITIRGHGYNNVAMQIDRFLEELNMVLGDPDSISRVLSSYFRA